MAFLLCLGVCVWIFFPHFLFMNHLCDQTFLLIFLSFALFLSLANTEEQCVLILLMLCCQHSVWGPWNINADTHMHTPSNTKIFKHFIFFFLSLSVYTCHQKIRKYSLSCNMFGENSYTCKHTLHKFRVHSSLLFSLCRMQSNICVIFQFAFEIIMLI